MNPNRLQLLLHSSNYPCSHSRITQGFKRESSFFLTSVAMIKVRELKEKSGYTPSDRGLERVRELAVFETATHLQGPENTIGRAIS